MERGRLQTVVTYIRRMSRPRYEATSDRELLKAFASRGDQAAFTLLVERHAGMVLGVCQRVLRNHHEAEDAAQATFFVLARKAGQVPWRESIAPWLYSVALRVAQKARTLAQPFHDIPRRTEPHAAPPADEEPLGRELRAVIDNEIQRLPEKLRGPIILCYLEGMTYDQAAQHLGWRATTLKGRLDRARSLLRNRLEARDLQPGVGLPLAFLDSQLGRVAMPARLAGSIARIAVLVRIGEANAPGLLSPTISALMSCPVPGMTLTKVGLFVALIMMVGVAAVGGALLGPQQETKEPEPRDKSAPTAILADPGQGSSQPAAGAPVRLDRFGDPLPDLAIGRLGTTRLRHGSRIRLLRFTSDDKTLVSQGEDGVRIWDSATAAQRRFFPKQSGSPTGADVDVSPDGKLLAAPGEIGVGIWEIDSGRLVRTIGNAICSRTSFSPDAATLATVDGPGADEISLSNVSSGSLIRRWKEPQGPITSLLFAADGQTLITGNTGWRPPEGRAENHISVWDPATGKEKQRIDLGGFGPNKVAVSRDGRLLAAICHTNMLARLLVWDLSSGNELWRLDQGPPPPDQPGRPNGLNTLTFFPDGKLLIAGQGDDQLATWSAATGLEKRQFSRIVALAGALAVSRDGKTVAAGLYDSAIRLIDWESGKDKFPSIAYPYREVAGIGDHGRKVVMRGAHDVVVWDPRLDREKLLIDQPERQFYQVRLTDGNRHIQIWEEHPRRVGEERAVSSWDLATGAEVQRILCPQKTDGAHYPLALAPDGKTTALFDLESPRGRIHGDVILMEVSTGKIRQTLTDNGFLTGRAMFTPDGQKLVLWRPGWEPGQNSFLPVWDINTPQRLTEISYQGPKPSVPPILCEPVISPDGQTIAVASSNQSVAVFDLSNGDMVRTFKGPAGSPQVLAFSPDGRCIALGGQENGVVAVVELATGRERHHFVGHEGKITSLGFAADGKMLVSHSEDTTALAWDLTSQFAAGSAWGKPISDGEFASCWDDLANEDAPRACRAMQRLASVPKEAVVFLGGRLAPARAADVESKRGEGKVLSPGDLRIRRAIETLERMRFATPEGRSLLEALAGGAAGANLTKEAKAALSRLGADR